MGHTATIISVRTTVATTRAAQPAPIAGRFGLAELVARFQAWREERQDRSRNRRTALAISEEARIHAQMRYRRMRYRHMRI